MNTKRPPTRWTFIRKTRRHAQRRRSGHWCAAFGYGRPLDLDPEKALTDWPRKDEHDVGSSPRTARPPQPLPTFVELVPALLPGSAPQWTIELQEPDGRKMTLSVRGIAEANLLALLHGLRTATP